MLCQQKNKKTQMNKNFIFAEDELDNTFDLGVLFNHKLLREATSKIK
jgi:hypothetical protein